MTTKPQQLILLSRIERQRTSHIFHLVMSVVLFLLFVPLGLGWAVVIWPLCALSNAIERKRLERQLEALE